MAHDFSSWLDRLKGVLVRSGLRLLVLVLFAAVLPGLVLFGVTIAMVSRLGPDLEAGSVPWPMILASFAVGLVWLYFISATGLAGMKVITSDAAGEPVRLRHAFRTSLRLALPTSGWVFMAGVAFAVGALACFLPALYVGVVFSLLLPAMAFERQDALTRSRELVHRNFWPTVGRLVFLGAAMNLVLAPILLLSIFLLGGFEAPPVQHAADQEAFREAYQASLMSSWKLLIPQIVVNVIGGVVWLCAILVTYVELRARSEAGVTTAHLLDEVNA